MEFFDFSYLEKAIEEDTIERRKEAQRNANRKYYYKDIEKSREKHRNYVKTYKEKNPERHKERQRKHNAKKKERNPEKFKEAKKNQNIKERENPINYLRTLVRGANKRDKGKNRQCDLDKKWITENAKMTNCPYCGHKFTCISGSGRHPHNRSIHRINNKIGHTKKNSIVICCIDNYGINEFGEDAYDKQCHRVAEYTASFTKSLIFLKKSRCFAGGSKGGYGACLILP